MQKNRSPRNNTDNPSWWTAPEKITMLEESLGSLKYMAQHLLEHIDTNKSISIPILREIHGHVDDMDIQLNTKKREDKTIRRSSSYNNSTLAKKIIRNMNK